MRKRQLHTTFSLNATPWQKSVPNRTHFLHNNRAVKTHSTDREAADDFSDETAAAVVNCSSELRKRVYPSSGRPYGGAGGVVSISEFCYTEEPSYGASYRDRPPRSESDNEDEFPLVFSDGEETPKCAPRQPPLWSFIGGRSATNTASLKRPRNSTDYADHLLQSRVRESSKRNLPADSSLRLAPAHNFTQNRLCRDLFSEKRSIMEGEGTVVNETATACHVKMKYYNYHASQKCGR